MGNLTMMRRRINEGGQAIARVVLENVGKTFGNVEAVEDFNLTIEDQEFAIAKATFPSRQKRSKVDGPIAMFLFRPGMGIL